MRRCGSDIVFINPNVDTKSGDYVVAKNDEKEANSQDRAQKWKTKLERNVERDKTHMKQLRDIGWKAIVIWECEIEKKIDKVGRKIAWFLRQ